MAEQQARRFVCDVCGETIDDETDTIEDGDLHNPPRMVSFLGCKRGRWRRVPGYTPHPGPFPVGERGR
jgi:hypothetical protein